MEERRESRFAANLGPSIPTSPSGMFALHDASPNPVLATDSTGRIRQHLNERLGELLAAIASAAEHRRGQIRRA